MRSLDEIKQDWKGTQGFLGSLTIDATNGDKLDLVIELLIGLHESQERQTDRIVKAIENRRLQ